MGGRGARSNENSVISTFKKYGVIMIEDKHKLISQTVSPVLKGFKDVLDDFGIPLSVIKSVEVASIGGRTFASMDGTNALTLNSTYFGDKNFKPKNSKGFNVSDTIYGTGTHEAGHLVVNEILKKVYGKDTPAQRLERSRQRKKGTIEKQVLNEAKKRYGSNPKISGYGSTHVREKIAEAVSDVYSNGKKANPYSKVIVDILKQKYKSR